MTTDGPHDSAEASSPPTEGQDLSRHGYPSRWADARTGEWVTPQEWQRNTNGYEREERAMRLRLVPVFLAEGIDPLQGVAYDERNGWKAKGMEPPDKYDYRALADDLRDALIAHFSLVESLAALGPGAFPKGVCPICHMGGFDETIVHGETCPIGVAIALAARYRVPEGT